MKLYLTTTITLLALAIVIFIYGRKTDEQRLFEFEQCVQQAEEGETYKCYK